MIYRSCFWLSLGAFAFPSHAATVIEADVCVYGGTSGGVVAAVQAARMGKKAVILEPGKHLGGMSAGGLGWTDFGSKTGRAETGGMAREFYRRVGKHYGKAEEFHLEPHVAEQVFNDWVKEANVPVVFQQRLQLVKKEGRRITEIVMEDGAVYRAAMFIDATYEGDLMAKAGVSYVVGREANAQYGETLNGIQRPATSPNAGKFEVRLDPYLAPGNPASGPLPLLLQPGELGEVGAADKRVQSYNYRVCLTTDEANMIPLAPPEGYKVADFELLARWVEARVARGEVLDLSSFCKYDPLPHDKFDFNNRWPISTDFIGGSSAYPEAGYAERERIARQHEYYLRGFFHFLATDPRVPENVRMEMKSFGLCKDEFVQTGGWPHQLYVREARRMVSDFVMTQRHCQGKAVAAESVGLAAYGIDIHAVRRIVHQGQPVNEGSNGSRVPQAYPIAYGSIVPKAAECENLFVTFCLSASHVAFGSIRMEPVFMVLSQSAATAACLAIDEDAPVQKVDYAKLQERLLADRQVLEWNEPINPTARAKASPVDAAQLSGIVVDDDAAEFTGEWLESTKALPFIGAGYRHDNSAERGKKSARFTPELPAAGRYEVRLLYPASPNRATNVKVTVMSADGEETVLVNQRDDPLADGVVRAIGVFNFKAGKEGTVVVSNAGADGFVVVDAVQFVPEETAQAERDAAKSRRTKAQEPVHLAAPARAEDVDGKSYDLAVIGGTPAGIACAVLAAREGLDVLLVQHTRHLGGMMTTGLMQWDALYGGQRAPLFSELLRNIEKYYRETYGENSRDYQVVHYTHQHYPTGWAEPHVAEREFNRLVAGEPRLTVLLGYYPTAVERDGALLRRVTLQEFDGTRSITASAGIFADATYEGDLAALANVPYRVGREGRDEYNEPHAGKVFTNIGEGPAPRDAVEGRLNIHPYRARQGSIDPTSPFTADGAVQAYNMRFCVTKDPANRIMLTEPPPNYNREEYVHYGRKAIATNPGPNQKSHMNSPILPGENHEYPEADWATRQRITRRHLEFGLGLIWFLQNDESVSPAARAKFREWGLAKDEFPDNNHVPYEMYVREARRIVGRYVYTEHDNSLAPGFARTPVQPDSVAITDWYMDSHACTTESRPGYHYDGKLILTEESRPGQIPYRSLLPQGVDNLLVPVCLSATHVAWGAVRLEPVWMQTGEAAGFAAALALKNKTTPAQLDADLLVRTLVERRSMVSFFNDVDVLSDRPWAPAVQYLGTKGFFHDYNARPEEPLKQATGKLWAEGFTKLLKGELDPNALARAVAEAECSDKTMKQAEFAALLPSSPKLRRWKSQAVITRGEAARLMFSLLP